MNIRVALAKDHQYLADNDRHVSAMELKNIIALKRVFIAEDDDHQPIGWLRYGLFWDNTPFMNMLYVAQEQRGKGYGAALVAYWENEMLQDGYLRMMTSTASNEQAQHFYQKSGYLPVGGFVPWDDPYELILVKELTH